MHCLYGGYNLHQFSDALGLVSIGSSTPINKIYSFVIFISLLINAVILLLKCRDLILYLYIFFLLDVVFST